MSHAVIANFIDRVEHAFHEGDPQVAAKATEAANVRMVQEQYRAIARGDFTAFLDYLDDDIEFEVIGPPAMPMTGRWRGRLEVVEAVRRNFALLEEQRPEVQSVVAQGDTVVLMGREHGKLRSTGRSYDTHFLIAFTFRNGKVVRIREMVDSAALLEASQPI